MPPVTRTKCHIVGKILVIPCPSTTGATTAEAWTHRKRCGHDVCRVDGHIVVMLGMS